jgi:NAD(P)-dependent dehydrogenase (short-subunit alcohol dehydrogenase family)
VLLDVEQALGRVRSEYHGPRTLDLDLLLYGNRTLSQSNLTVPHPRMHERRFVLEPLAELAPHAVHPVLGQTVAALLRGLHAPHTVRRTAPFASPGRELAGQRAVVTGSTSGIGKAMVLELAAAGAEVIVHGRRSQQAADAVAEQVRQQGVKARTILADLRQREERDRLLHFAWDNGPIEIWINNAGADTLTGDALHWSFERKLEELLAVDVGATIYLSRACGERMRAAGRGVLLNIGWDQAEIGMEGDSGQLFGAAKAAVMAFTKSLALTLAPEVRVNCLAPGWIRTAWGETASEHWQERIRRETPLRRWGTPEDVAAAARWLVSPAAAFLTGQVIHVNGGAVR